MISHKCKSFQKMAGSRMEFHGITVIPTHAHGRMARGVHCMPCTPCVRPDLTLTNTALAAAAAGMAWDVAAALLTQMPQMELRPFALSSAVGIWRSWLDTLSTINMMATDGDLQLSSSVRLANGDSGFPLVDLWITITHNIPCTVIDGRLQSDTTAAGGT